MFWTADEDFASRVSVKWTRCARPIPGATDVAGQQGGAGGVGGVGGDAAQSERQVVDGAGEETERQVVTDATWRQRGSSHFVTYHNPDGNQGTRRDSPKSNNTTTFRIEPQQLTLVRFGDITWNHTFRPGVTSSSTIRMGYAELGVQIETDRLDIAVTEHGGAIHCEYRLTLTGVVQQVALELEFEHE